MRVLEKYLGNKTYMFPNGSLATPEIMAQKFPATANFVHVIETDEGGEVCFAVQNLAALRSLYEIDSTLSEEQAIAAIQTAINAVPEIDDSPDATERIAAALEYQVLASLPDAE